MAKKTDKKDERLGDLLMKDGKLSREQLDQAVQCQVLFGGRLGINLLEMGFAEEEDIRSVLEEKYALPSVTRSTLREIPDDVIHLVAARLAAKYNLVPVRLKDDTLEVAMLDPFRESAIRALVEKTGLQIKPVLALEMDIAWALERYYGLKRSPRLLNLDAWLEHHRQLKKQGLEKKKKITVVTPEPVQPLFTNPMEFTSAEGAPRNLDDFWDRVGRSGHPDYHLPFVIAELEKAESRKEVSDIILDFASLVFTRAMLFVASQDMIMGWDARGQGMDRRIAMAIMFPLAKRSVFKTVVETGAYYLGPVPETAVNSRFMAALGADQPKTALLLPITISGKVAAILYGDMGHEQKITGRFAPLQQGVAAAGQALQRLIIQGKSKTPKSEWE